MQFNSHSEPIRSRLLFFSKIDQQLRAGRLLADALKPYLRIELYYQLLLAEQHGSLSITLKEIGQYLQVQKQQHRQLKTLLEYPLILLVMLGTILAALLIFVFPELQSWQQQNQLPIGEQWPIGETLIITGGVFLAMEDWQRFTGGICQR